MESPIKTPEQIEVLKGLLTPIVEREPGPVLLCLQAAQTHYGYVPDGAVAVIAAVCNVSRADVHGRSMRSDAHGMRAEMRKIRVSHMTSKPSQIDRARCTVLLAPKISTVDQV